MHKLEIPTPQIPRGTSLRPLMILEDVRKIVNSTLYACYTNVRTSTFGKNPKPRFGEVGASGETRTPTPLRKTDFESVASTNSATEATPEG